MPNTKDMNLLERGSTFLFKGTNGFGKTAAAASFFKHKSGKIRFYDFDAKMNTAKLLYPEANIDYRFFGIHNFKDFMDEFESLQDKCDWDVIVVDSLTSLTITCVNHQLDTKAVRKNAAGMPVTSFDEVNGETVWIGKMLDISRYLKEVKNKHIIWTAHPVAKTEITSDGAQKSTPLLAYGPKIGSIVPSAFDEIYHFTTERTSLAAAAPERIVFTQEVGGDYAKSSLGLPAKLKWTNRNFYNVIKENMMKNVPLMKD